MAANLENGDPGMGLVQLKYARRGKKAAVINGLRTNGGVVEPAKI